MLKRLFVMSVASIIAATADGAPNGPETAARAAADDHIPTDHGGDLVIHPLKHATLALVWNDKAVYADPAAWPPGKGADGSLAFAGLPPPDLIVVTHLHPDHFDATGLTKLATAKTVIVVTQSVMDLLPPDLKGKARVLENGKSADISGIHVEAVPAYNITRERLQYHPRGRDNGYVLTFGGKRVYIAGDTEDIPEMRALRKIDVAFIPMNPPYTMSPEQAADAVRAFRPKIVYPYHYHGSDVAAFAKAVGPGIDVRQRDWY